jgi:hypothetical protein
MNLQRKATAMQINLNADKIKADIKKAWEENTALCLLAGATALSGAAKLLNARANNRNSKAWNRETKRRERNDRKAGKTK